ncbi:hypothetical protein N7481_002411 [Penicillium waksmanii]|uniref:uncharacterized protein n=1 Tax=Penicillium waksmanii TaxID=69791 RepID=UPI0025473420|nr:uncharacterized protein N7481_002411 [Penicillium waksmanii]KAJ5995434.1 hypothetical protein N7481_002411 [Penicillium waksmanii]
MDDYDSEKLALRLQYTDLRATLQLLRDDRDALDLTEVEKSLAKRKRVDEALNDREVALISLETEIERQERIAENISLALEVNFAIEISEDERIGLGSGKRSKHISRSGPEVVCLPDIDTFDDPESKHKYRAGRVVIDLTGSDDEDLILTKVDTRPSANTRSKKKKDRETATTACTACLDSFKESETFAGKCGHAFCRECLRTMFLISMQDEQLYPPRCCNEPVKPKSLLQILDFDQIRAFDEKVIEYSAKDRLYCFEPTCSKFIPKTAIHQEIATCPACKKQTHELCRSPVHPGVDCPMDEALQSLLKVAKKQKWKRCPKCHAMVSLSSGCAHIWCRCGHEFCYECKKVWKTCKCPTWPPGYR